MYNNIKDEDSYNNIYESLGLGKSNVYPKEFDSVLLDLLRPSVKIYVPAQPYYSIRICNSNSIMWLFKYSNAGYRLLQVDYIIRPGYGHTEQSAFQFIIDDVIKNIGLYLESNENNINHINETNISNKLQLSTQSNDKVLEITNFLNSNNVYKLHFDQSSLNQLVKMFINNSNVNHNQLEYNFSSIDFNISILDLLLDSVLSDDKFDAITLSTLLNKYNPMFRAPQQFIDKYQKYKKTTLQLFVYPVTALESEKKVHINNNITKLSAGELVSSIEVLIKYVGVIGNNVNDGLAVRCISIIKEITNHLFKKLISIRYISSSLIIKIHILISGGSITVEHSFYHSIFYLIARSSKLHKLITSGPFFNSIFEKPFNHAKVDIYGEGNVDYGFGDYEIRKLIQPSEFTFDYIFNYNGDSSGSGKGVRTPFSEILFALIWRLLALDRHDILSFHDNHLVSVSQHIIDPKKIIRYGLHCSSFNWLLGYSLDIRDDKLFIELLNIIKDAIEDKSFPDSIISTFFNTLPLFGNFNVNVKNQFFISPVVVDKLQSVKN